MFIYKISPLTDHVKQIHLPTHKTQNCQQKAGGIHDCDWSNPEALLDILILTHDHQRLSLAKQSVRGDKGIQFASALCA